MTHVISPTDTDANAPAKSLKLPRIALLDVLRGVALLAMASYHFAWDLEFFGYIEQGTTGVGGWKIYARLIAGSFLFLAGVSLVLGHTPHFRPRPFCKRLAKIAGAAAVISAATWFAVPQGFIFFGILHGIAAVSLIGILFLRAPALLTAIVAVLALMAPFYARMPVFDMPALWWVGLSTIPLRSNDYVPIFPWLAPFLAGMAATQLAVKLGWPARLAALSMEGPLRNLLGTAGRHSLAFYLIHQPVLIALVYLFSLASPAAKPDPVEAYRKNCVAACGAQQSVEFCTRFCDCTIDGLMEQNLFTALTSGAIDASKDERISRISGQCSMDIPPEE